MTAGDGFARAVLQVVADIPPGRVMTYGDVAATLGSRAARAVGTVLARSGSEVPWWRVIRASGYPAPSLEARALQHLTADGTPLLRSADGTYRVDLASARHRPASVPTSVPTSVVRNSGRTAPEGPLGVDPGRAT